MDFMNCNEEEILNSALFYFRKKMQPVLIRAKEKRPFENGWQKKTYMSEDEIISAFKNHKGNIGIRGGESGLMIIDCDDARFKTALLSALPMLESTLQSKGKKETGHFWVFLTKPVKKESIRLHFENGEKQTFADLQGVGSQVVVAPSTHPEGMKYQWLNNNPILPLDTDVFLEALDEVCLAIGAKNPYRKTIPKIIIQKQETDLFEAVKNKVRLSDVLTGHGETMNCIFHKEQTPTQAMRLYRSTDTVYCFSCGKRSDVIGIHAQINGLSQLESALDLAQKHSVVFNGKSTLCGIKCQKDSPHDGATFSRHTRHDSHETSTNISSDVKNTPLATLATLATEGATSHSPLAIPYMARYGGSARVANGSQKIVTPILLKNFSPKTPKTWIVDNILGAGTLAVLGGKRATFKSTISVNLCVRAAAGLPFLGHRIPKEIPVLYMDEENGDAHLADLLKWSVNSLPADAPIKCGENVQIICGEGIGHLWETLGALNPEEASCPKLIILDGLRRFLGSANENDAGEVSVFMQQAKMEAERLGACILFLHHARKSQSNGNKMDEFEDAMDSLRGSSDIMAAVSTAMITTRVGDSTKVMVSFPKTRWGKEPEPVAIDFDITEGNIVMNESVNQNQQDFIMSQHAQHIRRWAITGSHATFSTEQAKNGLSGRMPSRTVDRVLSWMVGKQWLRKPKKGNYEITLPAAGQQLI